MKRITIAIAILFCSLSCNHSTGSTSNDNSSKPNKSIVYHNYNNTTVAGFFKSYVSNHIPDFKLISHSIFIDFCKTNNLNAKDSHNIKQFFTIGIIHKLFTSKSPTNGSVGDIINIPYYWHWINPNPRYNIFLARNNIKLNDLKTLNAYPKYGSFADIDRTPYLFLSDLFGDYPKYRSTLCDSFSTFGWCSEREMSFIYVMEMMNFKGKVVSENNHSWSVLMVPMKEYSMREKTFKVKIDNTYDEITWSELTQADYLQWEQYYGNVPLANWYNSQAHSQKEKSRIEAIKISSSAIKHIEQSTITYLQKSIIK
ncbi:hypothetical protein ESA94_02920 [Lacibacter luteus]|uniref:Uncharacterized protein n=1 Tax=Lacibacter luteus TaxID=2508719 RepID=A0A4Q1CLU3_9BACT|nr:hypothetical protein [Lacibacter luteus]RXK61983.1 hypothetical protein ESA94_02920 [Lacibacter luteus]